jgi:hypothetical protein
MKALIRLNYIALGIPVLIASFAIINYSALGMALVSTMATGFMQVLIAIGLWKDHYKNPHLLVYSILVIAFFTMLYFKLTDWIWLLPPFLAAYMTAILYWLDKNTKPEK